jgi:hypothetical protein
MIVVLVVANILAIHHYSMHLLSNQLVDQEMALKQEYIRMFNNESILTVCTLVAFEYFWQVVKTETM